jgi:hypothetical protein
VSLPTDVEISRACNALATTLRDQRPETFEAARAEQIVTGSLGGERKLRARASSEVSGELRTADGDRLVALIALREGKWTLERKLHAGESSWALPVPAAHASAEEGA